MSATLPYGWLCFHVEFPFHESRILFTILCPLAHVPAADFVYSFDVYNDTDSRWSRTQQSNPRFALRRSWCRDPPLPSLHEQRKIRTWEFFLELFSDSIISSITSNFCDSSFRISFLFLHNIKFTLLKKFTTVNMETPHSSIHSVA